MQKVRRRTKNQIQNIEIEKFLSALASGYLEEIR